LSWNIIATYPEASMKPKKVAKKALHKDVILERFVRKAQLYNYALEQLTLKESDTEGNETRTSNDVL
jgi:triphosphoribosyl-dephospho-CoA synthetase